MKNRYFTDGEYIWCAAYDGIQFRNRMNDRWSPSCFKRIKDLILASNLKEITALEAAKLSNQILA